MAFSGLGAGDILAFAKLSQEIYLSIVRDKIEEDHYAAMSRLLVETQEQLDTLEDILRSSEKIRIAGMDVEAYEEDRSGLLHLGSQFDLIGEQREVENSNVSAPIRFGNIDSATSSAAAMHARHGSLASDMAPFANKHLSVWYCYECGGETKPLSDTQYFIPRCEQIAITTGTPDSITWSSRYSCPIDGSTHACSKTFARKKDLEAQPRHRSSRVTATYRDGKKDRLVDCESSRPNTRFLCESMCSKTWRRTTDWSRHEICRTDAMRDHIRQKHRSHQPLSKMRPHNMPKSRMKSCTRRANYVVRHIPQMRRTYRSYGIKDLVGRYKAH